MTLRQVMPKRLFAVICGYAGERIMARVAACEIHEDDSLELFFSIPSPFKKGDLVTVHLDDRTGAEELDINFHVWRGSYRGVVGDADELHACIKAIHFEVFHGTHKMLEFTDQVYRHPQDERPIQELQALSADLVPQSNAAERDNKLGIWITRSLTWPHTTVMAFLSGEKDETFLISHKGSFKSGLIHKEARCAFAIDHRASFLFEKQIDWNFTIFEAVAHLVRPGTGQFKKVQQLFVEKNPWELPFFSDPLAEVFCLMPERIICRN